MVSNRSNMEFLIDMQVECFMLLKSLFVRHDDSDFFVLFIILIFFHFSLLLKNRLAFDNILVRFLLL